MKTITFEVSYKTEPGLPKHTQTFNHESAATAFMFHIETNGGISVMQRVERNEPIKRTSMEEDYDL